MADETIRANLEITASANQAEAELKRLRVAMQSAFRNVSLLAPDALKIDTKTLRAQLENEIKILSKEIDKQQAKIAKAQLIQGSSPTTRQQQSRAQAETRLSETRKDLSVRQEALSSLNDFQALADSAKLISDQVEAQTQRVRSEMQMLDDVNRRLSQALEEQDIISRAASEVSASEAISTRLPRKRGSDEAISRGFEGELRAIQERESANIARGFEEELKRIQASERFTIDTTPLQTDIADAVSDGIKAGVQEGQKDLKTFASKAPNQSVQAIAQVQAEEGTGRFLGVSKPSPEVIQAYKEIDDAIGRYSRQVELASQKSLLLAVRIEKLKKEGGDSPELKSLTRQFEILQEEVDQTTRSIRELSEVRDLAETTAAEASVPQLRESQANTRAFAQVDQAFNAFSETASSLSEVGVLDGAAADLLDLAGSSAELQKVIPRLGTAMRTLIPQIVENSKFFSLFTGLAGEGATEFQRASRAFYTGIGVIGAGIALAVLSFKVFEGALQQLYESTKRFTDAIVTQVQTRLDLFAEILTDDSVTTAELETRRKNAEINLELAKQAQGIFQSIKDGVVERTTLSGVFADILNSYDTIDEAIKGSSDKVIELSSEIKALDSVLDTSIATINDYRQALVASQETIAQINTRIAENNTQIASLREQITDLTQNYFENEMAIRNAAEQQAEFAAQTEGLAEKFAQANEALTRQFELEDRAIERQERLGRALDSLVSEDAYNGLETASKLFSQSSDLLQELGTQADDVFKALAARDFSAVFADGADAAIGAALADLSDGIRSALGSEIIDALEREGQEIAEILAEQNKVQTEFENKRLDLITSANQDELDRLAKFLLERQRALEDFERERQRIEQDFFIKRTEAILGNDVDAFLQNRRDRRITLARQQEDFNVEDSRARQDFDLETQKIQANLAERLRALDVEQEAVTQSLQARIDLVKQATDDEIAKLTERYDREQQRVEQQIVLEEKRGKLFADLAANEAQATIALNAAQGAIRDAAANADRLIAYRDSLIGINEQIAELTLNNSKLTISSLALSVSNAVLNTSISNMERAALRAAAPVQQVANALEGLWRQAGIKPPPGGFNFPDTGSPPDPYDLEKLGFPMRATGGDALKGRPLVVGDGMKPELFVPQTNGRIYPDLTDIGRGGKPSIQITIESPQIMVGKVVSEEEAKRIAQDVAEPLAMQVVRIVSEAMGAA